MNWLVVGSGAIGSVVGGLLAESGEQVTLLGRPWHLDKVKRDGLRIRGILGEHRVKSIRTVTDAARLPREAWDVALVTVKSYDTPRAAESLRGALSPSTLTVSMQNGLGNWEALADRVPPARVVGGRVIFGVELEPGDANVTVWGGDILLGSISPELPLSTIEPIAERLRRAGLKSSVTPRIREALWGKVIYNCCLNPLCTLLEVPYGDLLKSESTRELMERTIEEAYAVAKAEKLALEPAAPAAYRAELFDRLIPATAAHHPSMLQDLRRGRRTEIDALNGAIVRLGEKHGIETPVNRFLTLMIRAKEALRNFSGGPGSHDGGNAGR